MVVTNNWRQDYQRQLMSQLSGSMTKIRPKQRNNSRIYAEHSEKTHSVVSCQSAHFVDVNNSGTYFNELFWIFRRKEETQILISFGHFTFQKLQRNWKTFEFLNETNLYKHHYHKNSCIFFLLLLELLIHFFISNSISSFWMLNYERRMLKSLVKNKTTTTAHTHTWHTYHTTCNKQ